MSMASMQVQDDSSSGGCQIIVHKAVFVPGTYVAGSCDKPTLQPGTPPSFTPATPGSWCATAMRCREATAWHLRADAAARRTPGRAGYFTPGFWTEKVDPVWTPGTSAVYTPGTKGTLPRQMLTELTSALTRADLGHAGVIIPGQCTPPSYTKASLVPAWIEKQNCV